MSDHLGSHLPRLPRLPRPPTHTAHTPDTHPRQPTHPSHSGFPRIPHIHTTHTHASPNPRQQRAPCCHGRYACERPHGLASCQMGASWNHAARMDPVQMLAGLLSGATCTRTTHHADPDPCTHAPMHSHARTRTPRPPSATSHPRHSTHPRHPSPRKRSFPTVVPGAFPCACPQHFVEARASPQRTPALRFRLPPPAMAPVPKAPAHGWDARHNRGNLGATALTRTPFTLGRGTRERRAEARRAEARRAGARRAGARAAP